MAGPPLLRVLLLLPLLLVGCALTPTPEEPPLPPAMARARYGADQAERLTRNRAWQVRGILDFDTPRLARRTRFVLQGEETRRARLQVFGPMNQTALALTLWETGLRLVDPLHREVIDVPPTMDGLDYLVGTPLSPERLLATLLGQAEPLTKAGPDGDGWWRAVDGERLRLDGAGRVRERQGPTYNAHYRWPAAGAPVQPAQVRVELPKVGHLEATLEQWDTPRQPLAPPAAPPEGFQVQRPFDRQAVR